MNQNCDCNHHKKMKFMAMAASFAAGAFTALVLCRRAREKAGKWADEMRDEVTRRASETKDITQEKYNQIVDEIRPRYESMKDISAREMGELVGELKSHWETIAREAKKQMDILNQSKKQDQPAK